MIKTVGVSKNFKNVLALQDLNISFKDNQITGLIGFNGSGKTTTFNIITDLIEQTSGSVSVDDKERDRDFYKSISYVGPSDINTNASKASAYLKYVYNLYGMTAQEADGKIMEISQYLDFDRYLDKAIKSLSKGNQQKVKIIAALINPKLKYLLLDEPFDGLDPVIVQKIKNRLITMKNDLTIVITSHRMDILDDLCDAYYILKDGKTVEANDDTKSSRQNDVVEVLVNLGTDLQSIEKLPYVKSVSESEKGLVVTINHIENYKELSTNLLNCNGYQWHSIIQKSILNTFFERYGE